MQGDVLATYLKERKAENNSGFYKIRPKEKPKTAEEGDVLYRTKETAPETVSVQNEHLQTVVSSADGAKVLKDLDNAIVEYENDTKTKEKTFLGNLAKVLGAKRHGSNSQYATFEAVNGKVFTIRLANHNAKTSTFDNHDESNGISIVVTAQGNNGITNDGNAHIVEFFYDAIKLRKADGKPLVEILKSIKQALYSGEYRDTTGLAIREEVNSDILSREGNGVVISKDTLQGMIERVNYIAEKLHLNNVEVVTDSNALGGKRKKVKGWYNPTTGKITIVIPNHSNIADIEQTLLHEAVAHRGLRDLFGKDFYTFLDNVYNNVTEETKAEIDVLANKYQGNTRIATEEYLAMLAENTEFEAARKTGWWQKVKGFFMDMLTKAGIKLSSPLTDNELRYILWRSYENLINNNTHDLISEAKDIAKQNELKVGNYAVVENNTPTTDSKDLFRKPTARDIYDEKVNRIVEANKNGVKTAANMAYEAYVDSMESLKAMQDAIAEERGRAIKSNEDAYTEENHLSSKNKIEMEALLLIIRLFKMCKKEN